MLEGLIQTLQPTPEATLDEEGVRRRRRLAENLIAQGTDASPIRSPWQGAARMAQALLGGWEERKADQAEAENAKYNANVLSRILGGGGSASSAEAPAISSAAPSPHAASANGSSNYLPAFAQAGTRWGISPEYLSRTAQIESNMNPAAKNPSGASGLMQFVPSTAKAYKLFNPFDANASIDAGAHLAADNRKSLVASLGREPTDAELYLAHQQGAGGAAKLLANPNAPAESIVGHNAVVQNGGKPGMTAGQFAGLWLNKFGGAPGPQMGAQVAGEAVPASAAAPTQSDRSQQILAAMADPRLSAQNKQILAMMYQQELRNSEKATERFGEPYKDDMGNLVQRGANGQVHVISRNPAAAENVNHRHVIGGSLVDDSGKVIYQAPEKKAGMSEDAINLAAERELAGDHSWVTGLGRGAQGAENITAVQERAASLAKERGLGAPDIQRNTAQYGGVKAAARNLETFNSKMVALTEKVDKAADYANELSNKLPRGSFVPVTRLLQMGQAANSNPQLRELQASITTLVNEYASATGGGGQGTDASRAHALEMLNSADSPETFGRVINVMKREVRISHEAGKRALEMLYHPDGQQGNSVSEAPPSAAKKVLRYDTQGREVSQ